MQISTVLRQERERAQYTQASLAKKVGTSECSFRCYELDLRPLPLDVAGQAVKVLRSPRLAMTVCQSCPVNLFVPPYLDQVDTHPMTELHLMLREAHEAIDALERVDIVNKTGAEDLTPAEKLAMEKAMDQIMDLIPAAAMTLAAWSSAFGFNLRMFRERLLQKMRERGYLNEEEAA